VTPIITGPRNGEQARTDTIFLPIFLHAESFHSKLRDEFLNLEEFESVAQAQALADLWKEEYNTERPHSSLDYQTPAEFAARCGRYVPIEEDPPDPSTEQTHG
jgi:putative transposase